MTRLSGRGSGARLRSVIARKVASVVLSLALLHLTVARADASCASHSERATATAAVEATTAHHDHHGAPDPTPLADEEQCDAPLARDCCASVASCAFAFEADVRESDGLLAPARAALPVELRAPLSVIRAPEPPPPRA